MARLLRAGAPLLVTLLAVAALAASGATRRHLAGTAFEDHFYGFFFDRYPLFAFAVVYGAVRILAGAFPDGGPRSWARIATVPAAIALFLAVCLHPTFGGLVLRAGFATGGVLFMSHQPVALSYLAGTAAAAALYGLALGACLGIARLEASPSRDAAHGAIASFLALWWAAAILLLPRALGLGAVMAWPGQAPGPTTVSWAAILVLMAFLPHVVVVAASRRAR